MQKNKHLTKISDDEMEKKRQEMLKNADWRNSARKNNVKAAAIQDEYEERNNQNKAVDFIRLNFLLNLIYKYQFLPSF